MNSEPIQNPLFDDPLGITLKHARQRKELSIESVAKQLRLPVAVIEAMEKEAWHKLGAAIYVKSYLGSYLKLLGLPETLQTSVRSSRTDPGLVAMAPVSTVKRNLHRSWRRIIYLVMTGVLVGSVAMLAMHLQTRDGLETPATTLSPLAMEAQKASESSVVAVPVPDSSTAGQERSFGDSGQSIPASAVAASMAPLPVSADQDGLVLRFRGESWVDIVDASGQHVERGMVGLGGERHFSPGSVSRLTIGNASMVDASWAGKNIDLAPFLSENVARFEVSSSGEIVAPGG